MLGARIAALLAPATYLFGLIIALCWFLGICGPLLFLWEAYLWLSRALLDN
jgi:hypothetical protein